MATSHLLILILLSSSFTLFSVASSSYEDRCSSIVPQPVKDGKVLYRTSLWLRYGYARVEGSFAGRSYLLNESMVELDSYYMSETSSDGVLHVKARLAFQAIDSEGFSHAIPARSGYRGRRNGYGINTFSLEGYWSQSDGNLCMIGSSSYWLARERGNYTTLSLVLKLNLKRNSTIVTSLVKGTLQFKDSGSDSDRIDTIPMLSYVQNDYSYTLMSQANKSCSGIRVGKESLKLDSSRRVCSTLSSLRAAFELEYDSKCGLGNCNPLGKDFNLLPRFMALKVMGCSVEGKLHMFIAFSNASIYSSRPPFLPNSTFVAEGFWDGETNQLCVVACRILNSSVSLAESYVGDCSVGMNVRFPATLSIKSRSRIAGKISSFMSKDDAGYFDGISFRSLEDHVNVPGLKYEYNNTGTKCDSGKDSKNSKKRYPDLASYNNDMGFSIYFRTNGSWGSGYFRPLFIGNVYRNGLFRAALSGRPHAQMHDSSQKIWNVSYEIRFQVLPDEKWRKILWLGNSRGYHTTRKISAEGVYDSDTGSLCMVACRYLPQNLKNLSENVDRYDCEISINVQFPPLNPSTRNYNASLLRGRIMSTRKNSDSLYFDSVDFSSYFVNSRQRKKWIERMDFEIVMVLISLTLACVFVASQLYYVKKHPEVLSSISLLMLGVLTLGLMIRLVLNFEALFSKNHSRNNALLGIGGWREANEIIVRVITMVAFLLQFWLLQRTMSAKLADKDWLRSEGRVLRWCISLYIIGGLIALLVHVLKTLHHSLWEYLQSYAGLVLDGFLIPQILHNLFSNSKQKSLATAFYVGMTLVRALPHLYDVYRTRNFLPWFEGTYIYANADSVFYSPVWDIVIPCAGTVLGLLAFLQQRFGGGCIVPARFRILAGYERVSATDGGGSAAAEGEVQMN